MKTCRGIEIEIVRDRIDELTINIDYEDKKRIGNPLGPYDDFFYEAIREKFVGKVLDDELIVQMEDFACDFIENLYQQNLLPNSFYSLPN